MPTDISTYVQLGSTVTVVILFLNYLTKRDNKWTDSLKNNSDANVMLAKALQKLTDVVEKNSTAAVSNTAKITENVSAVQENTNVVDENTQATKVSNGHK